MKDIRPVKVAVVGSGMISDIYLKNMIERFSVLDVVCICSAHMENARIKAEKYCIEAKPFEAILNDPSIEMIVNLTPAPAHEDIIRKALLAGKHVYTEKTMTLDHASAESLYALAKEKGLLLGSAPDTFLGAGLQTARKAIDDGMIGTINSFAIAANRCDDFMRSFFRFLNLPGGGMGTDYAVYYLTALVSLLGPVERTVASVRAPYPKHVDLNPAYPTYGREIDTPGESEISAILKMRSGATGTLQMTGNSGCQDRSYFALFGTKGMLYLPDPNGFGGNVWFVPQGIGCEGMPERQAVDYGFMYTENSRGVGPADLAIALRDGRPPRADATLAVHIIDVLDAMYRSEITGASEAIITSCERPVPIRLGALNEEEALRTEN